MTKGKISRIIFAGGLTVCFSFCMQFGFSQSVQTITDKKDILIGEQIRLTIKARLPLNTNGLSKWLVLPDSIPHFDIVETGKADTADFKDDSKSVEQTITITSFDSGRWVFPALPVEFSAGAGQAPQIVQTDSFFVNVAYSPPDSTNELRDIKPIISVSISDYFWYYIMGGAILLLLIIYGLYRYFKKNKTLKPAAPVSKLSAFNEAMEELKKVSLLSLHDAAAIKSYHARLAEIFKNYLGRKQGKNLLNKTTGDFLINTRDINLPAENISDLATALRCTDAVKFAKYLPSQHESEDSLQKIKETIILTESAKHLNS
ncbi:MAG: hypothetical protein ABIO79_17665 [Ferruginibacter sp.]